jgi:hypothetical protein
MPQILRNLNGIKAATGKTKEMKRPEDILYVITKEDRNFIDFLKNKFSEEYSAFNKEYVYPRYY